MPRKAMASHYKSLRFKPFDMDHVIKEEGSMVMMNKSNPPVRNTIYGVMTHASLADADGNLLSDSDVSDMDMDDIVGRDTKDKLTVVAWAALYRFLFPKTVADVTQTIATGTMKVSMERWIGSWDFLRVEDGEYTAVSRATAESDGTFDKWKKRQTIGGYPVLRRSLSFVYGGAGSTMIPANELAEFLPIQAAATSVPKRSIGTIQDLLKQRAELHRRFIVSSNDEQPAIIREHTQVVKALASLTGWETNEQPT